MATTNPNQWVARIKPLSDRQTHSTGGITFRREDGWTKVTAEQAKALKKIRLHEMGTDTTKVFDVCLAKDAVLLEAAQAKKLRRAGTPDRPIDPTIGAEAGADELEELDDEDDDEKPARRVEATERSASPRTEEQEDELLALLEAQEQEMRKRDRALDELSNRLAVLESENKHLRHQVAQEVNEPQTEKEDAPKAPSGDAPPVVATRPGAAGAASAKATPAASRKADK